MTVCNGCNAALPEDQPLEHTENVLMGFVYGIEKTDRFPLNISIRRQEPDLLVFDDPLALTPCHVNVIPTDVWCVDWRMLLRAPEEGLVLVKKLEDAAWKCVKEQVLSNDTWRAKCLRNGGTSKTEDELRKCIVAGCNFPPSQFQLHVQYFLMPWLPSQYRSYLDGGQICKGRWFPLDYIKAVLETKEAMAVELETPLQEITAKFDALGVNYDQYWEEQNSMVARAHKELANWLPSDFSAKIDGDTVVGDVGGKTKQQVLNADKLAMQSAYPSELKTYYKHARAKPLPEFGAPQ